MNKYLLFILFTILNFNTFSDQIVNIWADNSPLYLGVSQERVWLKSYFLSNFNYYPTLDTEKKTGIPTIVTVSRELYFQLDELLMYEKSYTKDSITISKSGNIYTFIDNSIQLEISFSLEKPGQKILNIISMIYKDDNKTKKIVSDHYLQSWIIRIHSAENVIAPDLNTLDFDDILISATIIGEKFQWLWGVHDGVDYVYDSLK